MLPSAFGNMKKSWKAECATNMLRILIYYQLMTPDHARANIQSFPSPQWVR